MVSIKGLFLPLVLLLIVGLLGLPPDPSLPVQAQADQTWDDGCDARAVAALAPTTSLIDYQAACDHYRACNSNDERNAVCQFSAFQQMLAQCPVGDQQCHDGAVLMAAALLAYDAPFGEVWEWSPPPTVIEGLPAGLAAFWQGDDTAALAAYQQTAPEDFPYDVMLPLSRAVLYQRNGQPELALAEYDYAFNYVFEHPLLRYARSRLYAAQGRLDEASFEVAAVASWMQADPVADNPDMPAFLTALQAEYPLDATRIQAWLVYPVSRTSQYMTDEVHDTSLTEPRPVQLGVFDDLNLLFTLGLKNWNVDGLGEPDPIVQVLRETDAPGTYQLDYPTYDDNGGVLSLTEIAGGYSGSESIYYFEGAAAWTFLLAPADAPDPRLALNEQRYCEGGVVSRVGMGSVVTNISYADMFPLQLSETPAGTDVLAEITQPDTGYITVIGGPTCIENVTWWEGYHSNGVRGWFPENIDTMYNTSPATLLPTSLFCEGQAPTLLPRLTIGQRATVIPGLGANNLRQEPIEASALLASIPPDATFDILGGPVCLDNMVWWYADYNGVQGWTPEGDAPTYWLAPAE